MVLLGGGRGHAIDYSVIFARVTSVRDEFVDRPKLDVLGHRLREHASPPKVILGILPEGALGASLSNRSDYDCTPGRSFCEEPILHRVSASAASGRGVRTYRAFRAPR